MYNKIEELRKEYQEENAKNPANGDKLIYIMQQINEEYNKIKNK